LKSLVVGGTGFLGGAITDAVASAGHDVAVLSRGRNERILPDGVRLLKADRYSNLDGLTEERFDFVFDTCGYTPDAVERLLHAIGSSLERYVFVSSLSVYGDFSKPYLSESDPAPTATEADLEIARHVPSEQRASAFAYGKSYGPLKRACEIVAQDWLSERAIMLRSGLLVGAGDYTDRLTWWVRRIDQGGSIAIPKPSDSCFQMIDVRDVAAFAVRAAVEGHSGIYNLTGSDMTLAKLFEAITDVSGSNADLIWVGEEKIKDAEIEPWTELPLILPEGNATRFLFRIDTQRAHFAGLSCRPTSETLRDILKADRRDRERPLKCGISREKEQALLA